MAGRDPKISILIPIFNVEKYLRECIDSVVGQTLKDIEIICINDGSTDGSLDIIKEYAAADGRIRIIDKENSGYGDSMNQALKAAAGEFVGIVESDDYAEPEMFEELYAAAKKHDVPVVKSGFYQYFTKKSGGAENKRFPFFEPDEANSIINTQKDCRIFMKQPTIWSAIYRKSFLDGNDISFLPTPGASYQDAGFNFKVFVSTDRAYFLDKAFLHYRMDNEGSSVNSKAKQLCICDEYREIERFLRERGVLDQFAQVEQWVKYAGYRWNWERLAPDLVEGFIRVASEEYRNAQTAGWIDFSRFDGNDIQDLEMLLSEPGRLAERIIAVKKALVSVIVPVYNTGKYLRKCMESLLSQTLGEIEIVCVNDVSTDGSLDILREYQNTDPRVRVFNHAENGGLSCARNTGINVSHALYIQYCDSDDWFEPEMCKTMYDAISGSGADIAVCGANVIYEANKEMKASDDNYYRVKFGGVVEIRNEHILNTDVNSWDKIYRRSILEDNDIRFPPGLYYEDAYFYHAYMCVSKTACYLEGAKLYNYVRRSGSIMAKTFGKTQKAADHTVIMIHFYLFLRERNLFGKYKDLFAHLFLEYLEISKRYTPDEDLPHLYAMVRVFLKENGDAISHFDARIAPAIAARIPKQKKLAGLRGALGRIYKRFNLSYRRDRYMIVKLEAMERKIDTLAEQVARLADEAGDQ
ncbi:MAG: glycosyltransferase [Clostridiales Family XIII bacterium]|nr:glycosyltransferase [Clostridiales Family XIII bacterium]